MFSHLVAQITLCLEIISSSSSSSSEAPIHSYTPPTALVPKVIVPKIACIVPTNDIHAQCTESLTKLHRELQSTEKALFAERTENQKLTMEIQRLSTENSKLRIQQWNDLALAVKMNTTPEIATRLHQSQINLVQQGQIIRGLQQKDNAAKRTTKLLTDTIIGLHQVIKKTESELAEFRQKYASKNGTAVGGTEFEKVGDNNERKRGRRRNRVRRAPPPDVPDMYVEKTSV